jgi:hypothetical protein
MKALVLILPLLLLGCTTQPPAPPLPPPLPVQVVCALPESMTTPQPQPLRPTGDYTQRDVGLYLLQLHAWAAEGWARLDAVRQRSDDCVHRTGL